jgi:predicted dehydrogenase
MSRRYNRRGFLRVASAGCSSVLILSQSRSAFSYHENEKLNLAIVGAGGRGAANVDSVSSENIIALCDVDRRRAAAAFKKFSDAAQYSDYRKMLDERESEIDAVVVSAPNHVHVPVSVRAMQMGKHVYCEKPLAHSVAEARLAADVAAEKNLATQMGTQIHASENYRRIVELIRADAIGPVSEFHCWLRGGGSAGDRPQERPSVPEGLNWDLWLAVAPYRPYHPCYVPHDWHYWWDFGGGAFGNMGCHYLDLGFWALGLRHPSTVEAEGPPPHAESTPAWQHVQYEFPMPQGDRNVTVTWTHGKVKTPSAFAENQVPDWAWGLFVGEKGLLAVNYGRHLLLPASQFADFQPPEPTIPPSVGHHQEWIAACKTGSATTCNFDYSGAVTETMLVGNVAYRTGQKLEWDAARMEFTNFPAANAYLQRTYRAGWAM